MPSLSSLAPGLGAVGNPFASSAVGSVWSDMTADVPEINRALSETLLRTVRERAAGEHHRAILLFGDAGSGKTHLLQRLRLQLESEPEPLAAFCWLRMYASPSMVWRYIRSHLVDDITRRGNRWEALVAARAGNISSVSDRDLAVALEHLIERRMERDARAWLAGKHLPDEVLAQMGIANPDVDDETLEEESRRIVFDLLRFLSPAPVVLCLDQLEGLQAYPGDPAGLKAIGQVLSALHDEAPNAVIIACLQAGLIREFQANVSKADQDRLHPLAIPALRNMSEVRALITARLALRPAIAALRPEDAPECWPVRLDPFPALLDSPEGLRARKVFFECEQMFRAAQNLPERTQSLTDHLEEQLRAERRGADEELDHNRSTHTLSDGLPRLLHLLGFEIDRKDLPRGVDHIGRPPDGKPVIVVVMGNDRPQSLLAKLRRIGAGWNPTAQDLVILRDALHPLSAGAKKTRECLEELEKRGARIVEPSREALVALEAIRRLLAGVESADLTFRGDKIPVADVEGWVRRNVAAPLDHVLAGIRGMAPGTRRKAAEPDLFLAVSDYIAREKVAAVEQVAAALHRTPGEVESCARHHPERLGYCAGPVPVVYQRIDSTGTDSRRSDAAGGYDGTGR